MEVLNCKVYLNINYNIQSVDLLVFYMSLIINYWNYLLINTIYAVQINYMYIITSS